MMNVECRILNTCWAEFVIPTHSFSHIISKKKQKGYFKFLFLIFFPFFSFSQITTIPARPSAWSIIEQVRKKYAPDRRTAIFQIEIDSNRIVGKTNIPQAKKEVVNRLKSMGYEFQSFIKVLPNEEELDARTYAIVNISVGNLRSQPKESAEMVSQTMLGTVLKIYDKEKYWYQVQTPDNYIGWIEGTTFTRITKTEAQNYESKTKLIFTKPFGFSYKEPNEDSQTISDLTWGDLLTITDTLSGFYGINYPDNRRAYVSKNDVLHFSEWQKKLNPTPENLVKTAQKMMGLPYLWGGTSWKGIDCSGYMRMVYQNNGILLPRDASQQVWVGDEIDTSNNFDKLEIGDLLFFGEKAKDDKPEKVVHVAMWIGNNQFIHSSGMVKIGSFDKNSPIFDAHNFGRYLRSKRILGSEKGIVSLKK